VRSDRDTFANDIFTAVIPTTQPLLTPFNIGLGEAIYQDVAVPITFRIYGYLPSAGGVGLFFDNITLNGEVELVPEPAAWLLLSQVGVIGLLVCIQSRRNCRWSW
jgi:hypothetical protein